MKAPEKRLLEGNDAQAVLLRQANVEYGAGLDAQRAWRRQRERAPKSAARWLIWPSFAVAAVALGLGLFGHLRAQSPDPLAQAEPESVAVLHRAGGAPRKVADASSNGSQPGSASVGLSGAHAPTPDAARPGQAALNSHERQPEAPSLPSVAPAAGGAGNTPSSALVAPTEPTPPGVPMRPAVDCLAVARAGDAPGAERCFETQAAGQNLSAEVALYELARLRRDVLGKPAAALAALDDYLRRFPRGSLSGEVLFSRLELLVKAGTPAEVLRASDALLGSASGAERAPEIHFLRGNLYARTLAQPANAAREYAQAGAAKGTAGDEAAFLEGVNWEQAGEASRARSAFERYVARPGARHVAEAQARLRALAPAPSEPELEPRP